MIKLLVIEINDEKSFQWNFKSFPREVRKDGKLKNEVFIFLDNPTDDEIHNIIFKAADEFVDSIKDSHNERAHNFANVLVNDFKFDFNIETLIKYGEFSRYKMYTVKLIPYIQKSVEIYNTKKSMNIGMLNIDGNKLR